MRLQSTTATPQKRDWVGLIGDKDFFEKNDKLQRPLSYHITIWKWELPAILSTIHRGTGAAMAMVWSGTGIVLGGAAATGLFSVHDAVEFVRVSCEPLNCAPRNTRHRGRKVLVCSNGILTHLSTGV